MRVRVFGAPWALLAFAVAFGGCGSCTRYNEEFCCLSFEDCAQFDVDEIRACDPAFACIENVCVATDGDGVDSGGDDQCALAGGIIAFQTDRDGDTEIARVYADGSGFQLLTENTWPDEAPKLSPDGTKIAWISSPTGVRELFVMNHDGSDAHNVSAGSVGSNFLTGQGELFRWSPDNARLLFSSRRDGESELYAVDATGANLANLTNNAAIDTRADWSPDGSRIVFYTDRDTGGPLTGDLYVMYADGSVPSGITAMPGLVAVPRWSPRGTWIAHARSDTTALELWVITPTGSDSRDLGVSGVREYQWSPDGSTIVFSRQPDVCTITSDGEGFANLSNGVGVNTTPSWSPDGRRLIFGTDRDGNPEIYVMDAAGANPINLSNDAGADTEASWARCP